MFEAFLSLLAGKRPERIVWMADLAYWIAGQQAAGTAKPQWSTEEGFLELHKELGIVPYYYYEPGKFWAAEPVYDDCIKVIDAQQGDKRIRRFQTPVGEIREESIYSRLSCSVGITKHFVESERDLDVLLDVLRHRRLDPAGLAGWPARRRLWAAYGGLPNIGLVRSPLAAFFVEWAGVQTGSYLFVDCPEKVAEFSRLMEEQEGPMLDAVCALAPPLVHFCDNLSSECTTNLYDAHMAPGHRRRLERLHAAGIKCAVHLDGTVKGLLPKLVGAGFDAIEALTPKPGGDLDVRQIRELARSETVVLWGGVPGIMFAPPYTWEQVEAHVRQLLECWQGRPFIVSVADQVPPDGNIEFCRKIGHLVSA
jgi:hypothetical protein